MKAHRLFIVALLACLVAPPAIQAQSNRGRGERDGRSNEVYAERKNNRDRRVERRKEERNDHRDRSHRAKNRKKEKSERYNHHNRNRTNRRYEWRDHRHRNTWKSWGTWKKHHARYPRRYRPIPRAYFPRPGLCRVWYPSRAPGHQPPPVPCAVLNGRHLGQVIVLSHKGIVFATHPWYADHPAYYRHRRPYRHAVRPRSGIVVRLDVGGEWYIGL